MAATPIFILACYSSVAISLNYSTPGMQLRHPFVLAKSLCTMCYLSNGRVVTGLGVCGENKKEFDACGVPYHQRGQIMDEALEIMTRLWKEDGVSFQGKHFHFQGLSLDP